MGKGKKQEIFSGNVIFLPGYGASLEEGDLQSGEDGEGGLVEGRSI